MPAAEYARAGRVEQTGRTAQAILRAGNDCPRDRGFTPNGPDRSEEQRQERIAALRQRLAALHTRMDQLYEDKLDGKISGEFWGRKQAEYSDQALKRLCQA